MKRLISSALMMGLPEMYVRDFVEKLLLFKETPITNMFTDKLMLIEITKENSEIVKGVLALRQNIAPNNIAGKGAYNHFMKILTGKPSCYNRKIYLTDKLFDDNIVQNQSYIVSKERLLEEASIKIMNNDSGVIPLGASELLVAISKYPYYKGIPTEVTVENFKEIIRNFLTWTNEFSKTEVNGSLIHNISMEEWVRILDLPMIDNLEDYFYMEETDE